METLVLLGPSMSCSVARLGACICVQRGLPMYMTCPRTPFALPKPLLNLALTSSLLPSDRMDASTLGCRRSRQYRKAALNSFHLKLMITVASEVLASPLPNLAMLKKRGSSTQKASYRRDLVHDGASSMSSRISGAFTGDPGIGVGILHPQTVTSAWAAKRKADWERHEVNLVSNGHVGAVSCS